VGSVSGGEGGSDCSVTNCVERLCRDSAAAGDAPSRGIDAEIAAAGCVTVKTPLMPESFSLPEGYQSSFAHQLNLPPSAAST
jgi:hypothetical protein